MALPSSGQLSITDIALAQYNYSYSNLSLRQLSSNAGFSTPDAISEFYGYEFSETYSIYEAGVLYYDPCDSAGLGLVNIYYGDISNWWYWSNDGVTFNQVDYNYYYLPYYYQNEADMWVYGEYYTDAVNGPGPSYIGDFASSCSPY